MKILLASSEVYPFSKSGGLADVVGALGKALGALGHQVQILTPYYQSIAQQELTFDEDSWMTHVSMNGMEVFGAIRKYEWEKNVDVLFLEHEQFFGRDGLYGSDGKDFEDNAARFTFLSKALWHWTRFGGFNPDIVHIHDWQTALFPLIWHYHERSEGPGLKRPGIVMTIHNLAYQGVFPSHQYPLLELPWDFYNENGVEFFGYWNCLKAGIVYSDFLTTVSPNYAEEIKTAEHGCSLDGVLKKRTDSLTGILNGVDYSEWKTSDNPWLPISYKASSLGFKTRMKKKLQKEIGLPETNDVPLYANIGRIVEQKGMDILIPALKELLYSGAPFQFVQLGNGDPVYEERLLALRDEFPDKITVHIKYDHGMAHRIEAGSDFFIMPSRFEPCGLNQLYSLRYGSIPIVRATGGLDDSVTDISEDLEEANGFKFTTYSKDGLLHSIRQSLLLFDDRYLFTKFRKKGMAKDFSLNVTAQSYLEVYDKCLNKLTQS